MENDFPEFKEIKPEVLDMIEPARPDPLFVNTFSSQNFYNENDEDYSLEVKTEQQKDSEDDEEYIPTPKKKKTSKKTPTVRKSKRTTRAVKKVAEVNENGQSSTKTEMDSDMHFLLSLVPFLNKAPANMRLTLRFGIEKIIQDGMES